MKNGDKRIVKVVHMAGYKPSLFERFCLSLSPMHRLPSEETVMRFKYFMSKLYIYELRRIKPVKYDNTKGVYN